MLDEQASCVEEQMVNIEQSSINDIEAPSSAKLDAAHDLYAAVSENIAIAKQLIENLCTIYPNYETLNGGTTDTSRLMATTEAFVQNGKLRRSIYELVLADIAALLDDNKPAIGELGRLSESLG